MAAWQHHYFRVWFTHHHHTRSQPTTTLHHNPPPPTITTHHHNPPSQPTITTITTTTIPRPPSPPKILTENEFGSEISFPDRNLCKEKCQFNNNEGSSKLLPRQITSELSLVMYHPCQVIHVPTNVPQNAARRKRCIVYCTVE